MQTFGGEQVNDPANDWTVRGRIRRCLENNIQYVVFFSLLHWYIGSSSFYEWYYTTPKAEVYPYKKSLGYGVVMIFALILHNLSYILRNSYGRITGHMIIMVLLVIMIVDICYNTTHALSLYKFGQ